MRVASLGSFGLSWSATRRHWARACSASSWAKAVAMKAETTRLPLLPAWARALRMKWTRQRCQVVVDLGDSRLDALVGIRDDELDAAQAAPRQLPEECRPEGLGFGGADVHA